MSILVGILVIFGLLLSVSFAVVFRKLSAAETLPVDDDWMMQLGPPRYRPMRRVLDDAEYAGLRSHRACTRKLLRRLRHGRIAAFHGYLACLSTDYRRACTAIKLLMVQSADDRPDLAALLVRQTATFTWLLMLAEFRLYLFRMGIGRVEAGGLMSAIDNLRVHLHGLMHVTAGAAA